MHPELHIPVSEKLKTIPEFFGIRVNEEPKYQVVKSDGDFEIRQYDPVVLAKLTMSGLSYDRYREMAFKRLANYIFGGNMAAKSASMTSPVLEEKAPSEMIPMTAPVLQEKSSEKEWTMAFILPEKYSLTTAPKPLDPDISLVSLPIFLVAVVKYSGNNSAQKITQYENKLHEWLRSQPDYLVDGLPYCAQYDAPFVLPFVKRNEIHIRVHRRH